MSGVNAGAVNGYEVNSSAIGADGVYAAGSFSVSTFNTITVSPGWSVDVPPWKSGITDPSFAVDGPTSETVFITSFDVGSFPNVNVATDSDIAISFAPWVVSTTQLLRVGGEIVISSAVSGINSSDINAFVINGEGGNVLRNASVVVYSFTDSVFNSLTREERFTDLECLIIDYVPPDNRVTVVPGRNSIVCCQ